MRKKNFELMQLPLLLVAAMEAKKWLLSHGGFQDGMRPMRKWNLGRQCRSRAKHAEATCFAASDFPGFPALLDA